MVVGAEGANRGDGLGRDEAATLASLTTLAGRPVLTFGRDMIAACEAPPRHHQGADKMTLPTPEALREAVERVKLHPARHD